jgi:hypothetical protein
VNIDKCKKMILFSRGDDFEKKHRIQVDRDFEDLKKDPLKTLVRTCHIFAEQGQKGIFPNDPIGYGLFLGFCIAASSDKQGFDTLFSEASKAREILKKDSCL